MRLHVWLERTNGTPVPGPARVVTVHEAPSYQGARPEFDLEEVLVQITRAGLTPHEKLVVRIEPVPDQDYESKR